MEVIIPDANYTFDASAQEITLLNPFNVIDRERVLRITNLTTRSIIYDSERRTHSIAVAAGVITHTYDLTNMADTDVLQIFVDDGTTAAGTVVIGDLEVGDLVLSGTARYKSPAQLGDFSETLASKSFVMSQDDSTILGGELGHIDFDDQGDIALGVWGDGKFIYLANDTGGLHTYSVSDAGVLTHIDSDDQGDNARSVWGDGKFIYLANSTGGLHTYSVSDTGILTYIDSDDQGDTAYSAWGDGKFVYLANHTGGLHVYSVSNTGILTHIDSDNPGDNARSVWGDGKFIYLANHSGGLHVYSVSNTGVLTHVDSDDQGGLAYGVWGDGRFVYLANGADGLHTYSVSDAGVLTHIDSDDQGDTAYSVWGDGKFVYLANYTGGMHTYFVSDAGLLTHTDSDDQGSLARSVWGDGKFIYLANDTGGLHVYENLPAYEYDRSTGHHNFAGEIDLTENDTWIAESNYAGSDYINILKVNVDDEIDTGGTFNVGPTEAEEDSGPITAMDMPVSATPTAGDEMSYTYKIDGDNILTVGAYADSAGGVDGRFVKNNGAVVAIKTDAGAANYAPSALTSDYIVSVDTTAAARAVTISTEDRDTGTAANPRVFVVIDIAGNAGANNITISLETAGNIDGAGTKVISANYGSETIIIDGTNGFTI